MYVHKYSYEYSFADMHNYRCSNVIKRFCRFVSLHRLVCVSTFVYFGTYMTERV